MISNTFSADTAVAIYAGCSVVLCVLIYKARDFARFEWNAADMNKRLGSGKIYQVDVNSNDPARNAAVAATNLTSSMTPAKWGITGGVGIFPGGRFYRISGSSRSVGHDVVNHYAEFAGTDGRRNGLGAWPGTIDNDLDHMDFQASCLVSADHRRNVRGQLRRQLFE